MSLDKPASPRIHELLQTRFSPRAFADREVEPQALAALLEAARWAPSSYNEQPWAFLIARRQDPEDFERLLSCLVPANQGWARQAPILVLTFARLTFQRNGRPNAHALHDIGLAVAQLTFEATARQLAVHQMAGIVPDKIRQTFAVPDAWAPVTAVAIGHANEQASSTRQRKPLKEMVFSGAFGQPAPFL